MIGQPALNGFENSNSSVLNNQEYETTKIGLLIYEQLLMALAYGQTKHPEIILSDRWSLQKKTKKNRCTQGITKTFQSIVYQCRMKVDAPDLLHTDPTIGIQNMGYSGGGNCE